jgi:hypothetical protein
MLCPWFLAVGLALTMKALWFFRMLRTAHTVTCGITSQETSVFKNKTCFDCRLCRFICIAAFIGTAMLGVLNEKCADM